MDNSKKYFRVEEYIADLPLWMQEQLFVVREIILQSHPDIKEAIKFNPNSALKNAESNK